MKLTNFIVPVKSLAESKKRLSDVLSPAGRIKLVIKLLDENLNRLRSFFPEHNILIVTPDRKVAAMASKYRAEVLFEDNPSGLNGAVEAGTLWSVDRGYETQVVIAPDIARLYVWELRQMFAETGCPRRVVICAAKDKGTNAILTTPPDIIPFAFGEKSSEVMRLSADQRDAPCRILRLKNMALDIDTPEDLLNAYPQYLRDGPLSDGCVCANPAGSDSAQSHLVAG